MADKKSGRGKSSDSDTPDQTSDRSQKEPNRQPQSDSERTAQRVQGADSPAGDAQSQDADASGAAEVITLVCLQCGNEKFFVGEVPPRLKCERCGGTVFREFTTPTVPDEAVISGLEEQARSIQYGDSSPQTTRDEVRDLGQL